MPIQVALDRGQECREFIVVKFLTRTLKQLDVHQSPSCGGAAPLEQTFDALGPEARQFHLHLRKQPVKTGVHLRRLLSLARLYGTAELLGAITADENSHGTTR